MRVLIGCEESQVVCKEFRRLGHEAYSCDLKPCSGGHPEWHLQIDVIRAITEYGPWNLIGLHPDCRKLTVTSNRTYSFGKEKHSERLDSIEWTVALWKKAIQNSEAVYLENPKGVLNTDSRMPKWHAETPTSNGNEKNRAIRSKTFEGIARAMAEQWSEHLMRKHHDNANRPV